MACSDMLWHVMTHSCQRFLCPHERASSDREDDNLRPAGEQTGFFVVNTLLRVGLGRIFHPALEHIKLDLSHKVVVSHIMLDTNSTPTWPVLITTNLLGAKITLTPQKLKESNNVFLMYNQKINIERAKQFGLYFDISEEELAMGCTRVKDTFICAHDSKVVRFLATMTKEPTNNVGKGLHIEVQPCEQTGDVHYDLDGQCFMSVHKMSFIIDQMRLCSQALEPVDLLTFCANISFESETHTETQQEAEGPPARVFNGPQERFSCTFHITFEYT